MQHSALIVAHGQPSDPAPAEADLAHIAAAVSQHLPGWQLRSATLACPGALATALSGLTAPLIFPFFMADGWFIRTVLPRQLFDAGSVHHTILPPFGLMPETHALAAAAARKATLGRGWKVADTTLILAAHGSGRSLYPAQAARATEAHIAADSGFAEVRTGFIEEEPELAVIARNAGAKAICLPLFVARWGHVLTDIPRALSEAGFRGPMLAPIGLRPEVPGIIAGALEGA